MQSVVKHAFDQYNKFGKVKLFKSYNNKYMDGQQTRDFIYVDDCVSLINWLVKNRNISGIYNCGTSIERTFEELVKAMFNAINISPKIEYIAMPKNLRKQYQYYTKANMEKIRKKGYNIKFSSLEEGVNKYIKNYLLTEDKYK